MATLQCLFKSMVALVDWTLSMAPIWLSVLLPFGSQHRSLWALRIAAFRPSALLPFGSQHPSLWALSIAAYGRSALLHLDCSAFCLGLLSLLPFRLLSLAAPEGLHSLAGPEGPLSLAAPEGLHSLAANERTLCFPAKFRNTKLLWSPECISRIDGFSAVRRLPSLCS